MLDPDGWANGQHGNIISTFAVGQEKPESLAYTSWFRQWVDKGNRLDVVLNLHNPEPRGYPNVLCPQMEAGAERLSYSRALHALVVSELRPDFRVEAEPRSIGPTFDRLGAYLSDYYGALHVPYELNSQDPEHRLSLGELQDLGRRFCMSSAHFLSSPACAGLTAEIKKLRDSRAAQVNRGGATLEGENALAAEYQLRRKAEEEVSDREWFPTKKN